MSIYGDNQWIEAMKAKGHLPVLDEDGNLDTLVLDIDFHNGPGCQLCGESWCHHCLDPEDIPQCSNPAIDAEFRVMEEPSASYPLLK